MAIFIPHFQLAKLLGQDQMRSSAPTVGALFSEVQSKLGPDQYKAAMRAAILVNGRNISYTGGMDTPLRANDEVWMVFPSAGG